MPSPLGDGLRPYSRLPTRAFESDLDHSPLLGQVADPDDTGQVAFHAALAIAHDACHQLDLGRERTGLGDVQALDRSNIAVTGVRGIQHGGDGSRALGHEVLVRDPDASDDLPPVADSVPTRGKSLHSFLALAMRAEDAGRLSVGVRYAASRPRGRIFT